MDLLENYESLIRTNPSCFSIVKKLTYLAELIDTSSTIKKTQGLDKAISIFQEIDETSCSEKQKCELFYFNANAVGEKRKIEKGDKDASWEWNQPEIDRELFLLRNAWSIARKDESIPDQRKCDIITNISNLYDHIGRFIEAHNFWDIALSIDKDFGMALGNKGLGLGVYGRQLHDNKWSAFFFHQAYNLLQAAYHSNHPSIYDDARQDFKKNCTEIEKKYKLDFLKTPFSLLSGLPVGSAGHSIFEVWSINHCLFLNPLNDISKTEIALSDDIELYFKTYDQKKLNGLVYYFSQLQIDYAYARSLLFESEKTVPKSSQAVKPVMFEKLKTAYRLAYSILDKVANFLNYYFELHHNYSYITFKNVWHENLSVNKPILDSLSSMHNLPLRGLYWLSKDFFEKGEYEDTMEPEAKEMSMIRNYLEHRYLTILPSSSSDLAIDGYDKNICYAIHEDDFRNKTYRLFRLVRSSLIYLALTIKQHQLFSVKNN